MTIKSLLLGSAAALVAVSSSQAADIIMVEPEPVNFVRVCDVYGTGFFYIPGTETCLRVSGLARFQLNVAGDPAVNVEGDDYQVGTSYRLRLNFDAREETELGLLRAFLRVQGTGSVGGATTTGPTVGAAQVFTPDSELSPFGFNQARTAVQVDQAYIQLGGLLMGYRDSLWTNDIGGIADGLLTDTDGAVGDFRRNQVSYNFALGGFSAVIGLEDDATGDFVPDVIAKLTYSGAWGGAYVQGVYDETYNGLAALGAGGFRDLNRGFNSPVFGSAAAATAFANGNFGTYPVAPAVNGSNDAFAVKGGVLLRDLLVEGSQFKVEGHYAFDETVYSAIDGIQTVTTIANGNVTALPITLEYAIGAGYSQNVGDFRVAVSGQYGETFDFGYLVNATTAAGTPGVAYVVNSGDFYQLVGNVGYNITNNFGVLAEVSYRNLDVPGRNEVDQTSGFLRFERTF